MELQDSVFWSDSTSVLKYIKNETSRFRVFVANRVSEILRMSSSSQWRYVPTTCNPADLASRGVKVESFLQDEMWMYGPSFLLQPKEAWPVDPYDLGQLTAGDPEVKVSAIVSVEQEKDAVSCLINRSSSWTRLLRVMAWILRLKALLLNIRKRKEATAQSASSEGQHKDINMCRGYLSLEEIKNSELEIIKFCQRQKYSDELSCLQKGESVKSNSHIYKLNPISDDGVLRVGGRLSKAAMPEESKHPAIIAKDLHISDLIIRHIHEAVGHSGRNHVLSKLRQRYWIPSASVAIRKILSRCVVCRRLQVPSATNRWQTCLLTEFHLMHHLSVMSVWIILGRLTSSEEGVLSKGMESSSPVW